METEMKEDQKGQGEREKDGQPSDPVALSGDKVPLLSLILYQYLKEQKDKKDREFTVTEAHKSNDEVQIADPEPVQINAELKLQMEEKNELQEFDGHGSNLPEKSLNEPLRPSTIDENRPSGESILAGIIRKRKASESNIDVEESSLKKQCHIIEQTQAWNGSTIDNKSIDLTPYNEGALKSIGILPGIGPYTDSDRCSDIDGDSTHLAMNFLGRIMEKWIPNFLKKLLKMK